MSGLNHDHDIEHFLIRLQLHLRAPLGRRTARMACLEGKLLIRETEKPFVWQVAQIEDPLSPFRAEVSSSSPSGPLRKGGRELSVQAILHSQVSESLEAEDEEVISSQDDLFDGERTGEDILE